MQVASVSARELAPVQAVSVSARAVSESVPLSPPVPEQVQVLAASVSARALWPPAQEPVSAWARAQVSVQGLAQAP